MKNKNNILTFLKYNVTAGIATGVDFAVLIFMTEILHVWYLLSAVTGAVSGGITAFILERNWAFMKRNDKLSVQAIKYFVVWLISILLNIAGLFLLVEYAEIQYIVSKVIVAVIVGIGFNFLTHKYYIFK
ncbi:MAG: GtrA family protein [Bacteroidales bacterium]|nr:GtrA family protein [Bacteroidales bacterium]